MVVVSLCLVAACALSAAPARAAACPGADTPYAPGANEAQLRAALVCLVNNERVVRGLKPVAAAGSLELSAQRHLEDMAARGFEGHIAPAPAPYGATPHDRAAAAGYAASSSWEVGETLHQASQSLPIAAPELTTARAAVTSWMVSAAHCSVLLTIEAEHLGAAVLRSREDDGWVTDTFALEVGVPGMKMTPAPGCGSITGLVAPDAAPAPAPVAAQPQTLQPTGPSTTAPSGVALGTTGVRLSSGAAIKLNRGAAAAPLKLQCARSRCRAKFTLRVNGSVLGWASATFTDRKRLTVPIARYLRKRLTRRHTRATLSVQAAGATSSRLVTLKG